MASVANAFDLLRSSEQTAPSKPKKKKTKAKSGADAPAVAGESPVVASQASEVQVQEVVELAEAVPILEKSARTQGPNRIKLWKDWLRQVNDRSPKALKYRTPDGSIITFKELVLRSRALEIAAEGCITSPLRGDEAGGLQQLLGAFLPRSGAADAAGLAAAIGRLGELLAEDAQSFDTLGAAQRAVHTAVATLKAGRAEGGEAAARPATLQERLARIEREAGKQHGFLASVEKLAAAGDAAKQQRAGAGGGAAAAASSASNISRAHVESASELVKLYGEKFDLLQGGGTAAASKAAASGPNAAAVRCLQELKDVISNHLKEAAALEAGAKGAAKGQQGSAEASRAQAVASMRREEAVLGQQASELAGKIRLLESQLAQLRSQAAEVEDKRARLQQQQAAALEKLGAATGRKLPGLSARHYNDELAATDQLLALVDPSHCAADGAALAAAQAEHGNAAEQYMASLRNLMQMACSNMADIPAKAEFVRQRIAQAEKLASLGGLGKDKSTKTRDDAQKMLDDMVRTVSGVMRDAQGALEGMRARYTSFSPAQQQGLTQAAYEIEDLAAFIGRRYDHALAAVRGRPLPAGAGGPGSPVPAATAARAPPSAAVLSGADGTALPPGGVRPPYGANLGPIQPPAAAAPKAAAPGPASAAAAAAAPKPAAPPAAANGNGPAAGSSDGFKPVGGKKGRRKA